MRITAADLRRRHAGARVLLVEDHAINREVAADLLQAAGLSFDTAENGRIAVEKVRQHGYALILMDMLMPEMDGLQATRAIRQLSEGQAVPIIAMTANAFEEDRRACQAAGMNDFIAKPINLQSLYLTLDRWLSTGSVTRTESEPAAADAPMPASKQEKVNTLLRLMASTHREDMGRIRDCLQRGAHDEARRIAHSLMGVAATLGARDLFGSVAAVEAKLRQNPGISAAELADSAAAVDIQLKLMLDVGKSRIEPDPSRLH
jgi:CheY-like chemotaxis protein